MIQKIGLFGGSFDPIHLGHIITAQIVFEARKLDKIIFMPCYFSPHKTDAKYAPPIHRLNMVMLAIKKYEHFSVSDFEISRNQISYTIDTINELRKKYSDIELIIGQDNLDVFDKWHKPDEIISKAKLVVLRRNFIKKNSFKNKYYESAIFVDTPIIDISSTEIKNRIKNNLRIDFLTGEEISNYIIQNNLYR